MFTSNFKTNCLLAFNLDLIFSDGLGRVLNVFVRQQIDRQTDRPPNEPPFNPTLQMSQCL